VHLDADMVRNQPNDALACVGQAFREAIDPQPPVWIDHHLDNTKVFQQTGNAGAERIAQHARASCRPFPN
jgi:hypothetical protein